MSKIIVISGLTAGGKTTLVNSLARELKNSKIISFDNYDIDQLPSAPPLNKPLSQTINLYDIQNIISAVNSARYKYDYILVDYPFGNRHELFNRLIDLTVYIKTPLDILLARRILRDFSNKDISTVNNYLNVYLKTIRQVLIENENFIVDTADLVLAGEAPLATEIEKVVGTIKSL
ncbi:MULTISPECIES: adenylylsulfate kinase [Liquorilactobacillus]|jgi:uridine kinase|uniref:adenylylsulfate kinase n=1 Tax=Liquorilactobacillus TaxID=2767888 RepID=UPI00242B3A2D|nr:adenylylsulfate kinase [Liquorilactobacillus nagelii]MCI1699813.1 adenylylsulfate kinase [Liquorilactobacillus nagelii]